MYNHFVFLLAVVYAQLPIEAETLIARGSVPVARVGGLDGSIPRGIPGGIGQCLVVITQFHVHLANFAVENMGPAYTLRHIRGVRVQIVAGTIFHLELHVFKPFSLNNYELCDAQVFRPLAGTPLMLNGFQCKETCGKF